MNKDQLVSIGEYILQGLTEAEACILSDVPLEELNARKEASEDVRNFLEKQKIKFKLAHLKEIQQKKSGNNSQWLLEKLRPDEFGSNKGQGKTPINIISQIIQNIQNGESTSKITPRTRGDFLIGEESNKENIPVLDIGSVLK